MTHSILIAFIFFLLNFRTNTLEFENTEKVSQELNISHYDCTKMLDNRMYSLNKVAECKFSAEKLYIASATITLYRKKCGTDLSATMCSVKVHVFRSNCGFFSRTTYINDQNSITYDIIVTPEMCRLAWKIKHK